MLIAVMVLQFELFATVKSTKSSKLASLSRQMFTWVKKHRKTQQTI